MRTNKINNHQDPILNIVKMIIVWKNIHNPIILKMIIPQIHKITMKKVQKIILMIILVPILNHKVIQILMMILIAIQIMMIINQRMIFQDKYLIP